MYKQNELRQPLHAASLGKRAVQGAGIAFVLITVFLFNVEEANPAWPSWWFIRPLITVSLAGAVGGIFYYFMDNLRYKGGWRKAVANILSSIVYLFGLWISSIAGLDGTLWD